MRHWRILIVDDSPVMRSFIRRVIDLCDFGTCQFDESSNGEEALDCIARNRPDIVLTDINMPVMNGEEFLKNLAARKGPVPNPPIIVVSTDSTHTRVARMQELGATSYLRKPFTPEDMREVLEATTRQFREVEV